MNVNIKNNEVNRYMYMKILKLKVEYKSII